MEKPKMLSKINIDVIIKILFGIANIIFVIPSIIYLIKNGTILGFNKEFCFLLNDSNQGIQTLLYIIILLIITILYCIIIKRHKSMFKNIKSLLIYVAIIASIYLLSISFTSSDVFYYLGIGRIDGKYNQNPYYTTIKQFVETDNNSDNLETDSVLNKGYKNYWSNTTVVYGPMWTIICKIVANLSFGNIDFGLLVFRIFNIIIHILNCYLIYKISHKKIFSILYGLNPYIFLEGIMCVHNDIFVIFFILLALYLLLIKKKISFAIIALAMATAIKYFAILLLPIFIIYYFRKEKVPIRILKCIKYGLFFLIIVCIPYLLYIKDISVLAGILTQQSKFAKNFYIIIITYCSPASMAKIINNSLLICFIITYLFCNVRLLLKKEIKFGKEIKKYEYFIIAFLFLLITNFEPWYIMWIFPLMLWQKSNHIKMIIQISIIAEFANSVFLAYSENWQYGIIYTVLMLLGITGCILYNNRKIIKKYLLNNKSLRE